MDFAPVKDLAKKHGAKGGYATALVVALYIVKDLVESQAKMIAALTDQIDFLTRLVDTTCGK